MQTTANDEIKIRTATPEDAETLAAIYAPYVENTSITFEYTVPSVEEFAERIRHTLARYPYLTAEKNGVPIRLRLRFQGSCCVRLVRGDLHLCQSKSSKQWCRQPSLSEAGKISDSAAHLQCMCLHHLSESSQHLLP